jgi:hypothetical protein
MKPIDTFFSYRGHIQKRSRAYVSTKAFQNPDFSSISGIIFSIADLWNLPNRLGDDFLFVHNPIAEHKLDIDWLGKGKVFWLEEVQDQKKLKNKILP